MPEACSYTILAGMISRLLELLHYRELVANLVVRDLKVRYKNSVLGVLWSLVNPLAMMAVFTLVFTFMLPNNTTPNFPVFVLCGILPWNFFRDSLMGAIASIVNNAPLIKKVYFPREVLPISVILGNLVNFLLALIVLFVMILAFRMPLTRWAWLLPVVIVTQVFFTAGLGLILSTANVFYRDTAMIMEVLILAWFFLTPVFYPIEVLPQQKMLLGLTLDVRRLVYILNPMASLIATYRVILYNGAPPAWDFFLRTVATSVIILVVGYWFFLRYRQTFAEEV
ncbi:MAG: Teichoic acid translocation permease protein TagG [Chloroflexi bacterium ADurb.Bin180]|nr:MAG: Teichoic acid translocation permease protein TagG [Chloroflexi bacterium ADurb.Bin180]